MVAMRKWGAGLGFALALFLPVAATAASVEEGTRPIRPLLDCRKIGEATQRLACFDREAEALDQASRRNEITVLDKDAVRKTRRSLFGLSLPKLPFLSGGDDDGPKDEKDGGTQLVSVITSARSLPNDRWEFELEDGARWVTTEPVVAKSPAKGMPIVLKRATMNSFFASFGGGRSVRSRRLQ